MTTAQTRSLLVLATLAAAAPAALAQDRYALVCDWTDRVIQIDAMTGEVVNLDFITDAGGAVFNFQSPREAIQVGDEIWVSDQISDAIFRFTASEAPSYIATISGQLDNLRGMAFINGVVYVCNSGTANGAPGNAIISFSPDGTRLGEFPFVGSAHDIVAMGSNLLISNANFDSLDVYSPTGTFIDDFHTSNGAQIDFPLQILNEATSVRAAGLTTRPGVFTYSAAGDQTAYNATAGAARGLYRLGNGKLAVTIGTAASSLSIFDPATGQFTSVITGLSDLYYINGFTPTVTGCASADFNRDGDVGTDADIEAFFSCLAGNCCTTCFTADFNNDGDVGTDADIEAFFRVLAGQPC